MFPSPSIVAPIQWEQSKAFVWGVYWEVASSAGQALSYSADLTVICLFLLSLLADRNRQNTFYAEPYWWTSRGWISDHRQWFPQETLDEFGLFSKFSFLSFFWLVLSRFISIYVKTQAETAKYGHVSGYNAPNMCQGYDWNPDQNHEVS